MLQEKSNTDGPGDGPQSSMSAVLASGRGVGGRQPFDWTATYTLRLEMLPESHVSPRMAAKILFCGKAVRMLMETAAELRRLDVRDGGRERDQTAMGSAVSSPVGAIYGYVSSGGGSVLSTAEDGGQDEPAQPFPEEPSLTDEGQVFIDSVMARHAEQSGYTLDELDLFSNHFHSIVGAAPTSFVGSFESLIESVNKTISSRLWLLLKNRFGFIQFLVGLRNTYLLGKGEMFQAFLDGILKLMSSPAPADSQVDAVLTWDVVRSAAKLLNLDEDVLADVLKLRVNSPSVSVVDFSVGDMVKLHGVYTLGDLSEGSRHRHVCLGMPSTHANGSASPGLPPVVSAALTVISRGEAVISSVGAAVSSALSYSSAAATLNDAKYILKGFTSMCLFTCEWNEVVKQLSPAHPLMPRVPSTENSATVHPAIMLGSILCTLHDTPLVQPPPNVAAIGAAAATVPSPYGLAAVGGALRCVGVGVSVHARVVSVGADKLDYFARVFIWSNHPASGETFTAGASEISLGPSVSSPGKSAYATGRRFSSGNIEGHILSTSGEIPLAFGASSLSSPEDHTAGVLQAAASLALEVEYYRDLTRMTDSEMVSTSSSKTAAVRVPTGKGVTPINAQCCFSNLFLYLNWCRRR